MALNANYFVEDGYTDVADTEWEHYTSLQREVRLPETLEKNVSSY